MNKKGFTLVELLAVIAILAILVIVAMPNVLGMFNQAKSSTFVTEVQEYMNAATTKFMTDALISQGKGLIYYSSYDGTESNNPLDMSGGQKGYYIQMDRNGQFDRVILWDANFCYDSTIAKDKDDAAFNDTNPIEKADVLVGWVYEVKAGDGAKKKSGSNLDYNLATNYDLTPCASNKKAQ